MRFLTYLVALAVLVPSVALAGSPLSPTKYWGSPTSPLYDMPLGVEDGGTGGTGTVRDATTNTTLALADCGDMVKLNSGSAITATVPLNSSVPFTIGCQVNLLQYGAGAASVVATSGVTIRKSSTLNFVGQWSRVILTKIGTDEWLADGMLQ